MCVYLGYISDINISYLFNIYIYFIYIYIYIYKFS